MRSRFVAISISMLVLISAASEGRAGIEFRPPSIFASKPGSESIRAHPRGVRPVPATGVTSSGRFGRSWVRPFGSVHGGLETGIGYGYPAPYPTGGGASMELHRLFRRR